MNENKVVGIVVALEEEAKVLSLLINNREDFERKGQLFIKGNVEEVRVVMALSGIGKVNAARTVTLLSELFSPSYIISTGIAGGLGVLKKLDVLIASGVVQHDFDLSDIGRPKGAIPGFSSPIIKCNSFLTSSILEENREYKTGVIATGDQFIGCMKKANEITTSFDVVACDMESGAVGQICHLEELPFIVIRVISDDADDDAHDDITTFAEEACLLNAKIVIRAIQIISNTDHKL